MSMNRRSFLGCAVVGAAAAATAGAASFGLPRVAHASTRRPSWFAAQYRSARIHVHAGAPFAVSLHPLRYQNPNFAMLMKDLGPDPTDDKRRRRRSTINDGPHELSRLLAHDLLPTSTISASERSWLEHTVRGAFAVAPSAIATAAQSLVTGVHSGRTGPRHMAVVLSLVNYYGARLGAHYAAAKGLEGALQAWTHENIGLYCSGFAGQFARAEGLARSPHESPSNFLYENDKPYTRGPARAKLEEIQPGDALIFQGETFEHIGMIENIHLAGSGHEAIVDTWESCSSDGFDGITNSPNGRLVVGSAHTFNWKRTPGRPLANKVVVVPFTSWAGKTLLPEI